MESACDVLTTEVASAPSHTLRYCRCAGSAPLPQRSHSLSLSLLSSAVTRRRSTTRRSNSAMTSERPCRAASASEAEGQAGPSGRRSHQSGDDRCHVVQAYCKSRTQGLQTPAGFAGLGAFFAGRSSTDPGGGVVFSAPNPPQLDTRPTCTLSRPRRLGRSFAQLELPVANGCHQLCTCILLWCRLGRLLWAAAIADTATYGLHVAQPS